MGFAYKVLFWECSRYAVMEKGGWECSAIFEWIEKGGEMVVWLGYGSKG